MTCVRLLFRKNLNILHVISVRDVNPTARDMDAVITYATIVLAGDLWVLQAGHVHYVSSLLMLL